MLYMGVYIKESQYATCGELSEKATTLKRAAQTFLQDNQGRHWRTSADIW